MKNRIFIIFIMLLIFITTAYSIEISSPADRNIFRVAIIGDRTGGNSDGLKYFERAVFEINQLNPDFVIHIGDMVQGYTRDQDEWLREMEEFKSYISKLKMPYYFNAGNHDIFSPVRDINDRTYEELFKKYFAPLNYSFDYKNSHFVMIYTDEAMTSKPVISQKQLDWLKSDLEKADKTNVFIFMHKPIWAFENSNWDKFHEIIKQFPVKAVIAGHFHSYYKDINKDGIQYYVVGPAGAEAQVSGNDLTGYFHHYSILSIEDNKFNFAVVKIGNIESDDYVLVEDYAKVWEINSLSTDKTGTNGWLWQPDNESISGEIEIFSYNPTEKDISVDVKLDANMKLWSMNPEAIKLEIAPKSSAKVKATISSPKADSADIVPPQLIFQYNYVNSKGEQVPVNVKRRVFLRDKREIPIISESINVDGEKNELSWAKVTPLYNYTWIYSIYERPDSPPKVYITLDNKYLNFFVEAMDDKYSYLEDNLKRKAIFSDTIIFSTLKDGKRQDVVIFPFNENKTGYIAKDSKIIPSDMTQVQGIEYSSKTDTKNYYCEGRIPLNLLFGDESITNKDIPFNVGVIDNDLEAFIYLRSWAYDREMDYWGILKFIGNK